MSLIFAGLVCSLLYMHVCGGFSFMKKGVGGSIKVYCFPGEKASQ